MPDESEMKRFNRSLPPKKFVLWLFAILIVLPIVALPPYFRAKRSERWPTTDGVISANWVKVVYSAKFRRYSYFPEIEYRYHVGGKEYLSSRFSFGRDRYVLQLPEAQRMLDEHPMRSAVKV